MLDKNRNFRQKSKFSHKSKFYTKIEIQPNIEILDTNRNFRQKSNFFVKLFFILKIKNCQRPIRKRRTAAGAIMGFYVLGNTFKITCFHNKVKGG